MNRRVTLALGFTLVLAGACEGDGHLRGHVMDSRDGHTYLVIDDDNGGECGDLIVDGAIWRHPIGTAARVQPGVRSITCDEFEHHRAGDGIQFDVPEGVVFHFTYWGP